MADDVERAWYSPNGPKAPPRQPKPGELLFELVREGDHQRFRFELRFHGESYGWEVEIFEIADQPRPTRGIQAADRRPFANTIAVGADS